MARIMNKYIILFWMTIIGLVSIPNFISAAQTSSRAGLVVEFGDGSVKEFCISFNGDSLTGIELLERSGLDLRANYSPLGAAVCGIGEIGCPADDSCLKCQEPLYWAYWQLGDSGWVYSHTGAISRVVQNGDVDAWVWGYGVEPRPASFDDVCSQNPAPTHTPKTTETPLPTSTRLATSTPIPTFTSVPVMAATLTNTAIPSPTRSSDQKPSQTPTPALILSETPTVYNSSSPDSAALVQNNLQTVTITPIIVQHLPTEQNQSIPSNANLPAKKAPTDGENHQELTQPTPTPVTKKDFKISSVISDIFKTVQKLANVLLP